MQDQSENESVGTEWVSIFLEETHMPNQTYRLLSFFFSFFAIGKFMHATFKERKKEKEKKRREVGYALTK